MKRNGISKYKTTANKVEWLKEYDSYVELVKNHKDYKNSVDGKTIKPDTLYMLSGGKFVPVE